MKDDWIEVELGKLCNIKMGQSPPSSTYNTEKKGLPFFQGKAEFTELHPVVKKWCSVPKKTADVNDILLSVRAPVGSTNVANQKCSIGRGLAAISYPQCYKYVLYYLRLIERKLDDQGTGSTFKAISGAILKSQIIPLPPISEQRAIVSKIDQLFSDLNNGISNLKFAKANLKIYRQAVLKKAFEGELTKEWRKKQKDLRIFDKILEKSNNLPEGWKWAKLGEVAEVKRGKSKHRPRNDAKLFGGKYPFIQTGDVKAANGGKIYKFTQTYNEIGLAQSKLWPAGTLCLTIAANIAETAFLGINACFPDSVVGIKSQDNVLLLKYLNYLMQKLKSEIDGNAPATAQKNINVVFLDKLEIPIPLICEQDAIVQAIESRLSICDKLSKNIDQSLKKSEALRQSILKKAFEGKLLTEAELQACRQEPDWEPVKKLLARINKKQTIKSSKKRKS